MLVEFIISAYWFVILVLFTFIFWCWLISILLLILGKTRTDKILNIPLSREFGFVLYLGVTIPLITQAMVISCPSSFEKDCFDMMISIKFGDLVLPFSRSRQFDRTYFASFVWELVGRFFDWWLAANRRWWLNGSQQI